MIPPHGTRPQRTARHRRPHTTIHPQVPALDSLVKRGAEGQLVISRVRHDSGYWLFVTLEGMGDRLAVDVHQLDGVVVAAWEEFGAVLGEWKGAHHLVVWFEVGHLVFFAFFYI